MIDTKYRTLSLLLALSVTVLAGCSGLGTFHDHAYSGDTIAVAAGWKHHLQRGDFEVTITDANSVVTTYTPGMPGYDAVKASVNFHPDPLSSLIVSDRTNQDITPFARTYAGAINFNSTGNDPDWWETTIFLTLPDPMALGLATIDIIDTTTIPVEDAETVTTWVNITGTGGTPNAFEAEVIPGAGFFMQDDHFQSLERVDHFVVSFSGNTLPYAIQVDLTHDADAAHGGTGMPYVVNSVGHIKNLSWAPTGTNGTDLRVIMTPAADGEITNMHGFKFYVAGDITGLAVVDIDVLDPDSDVQSYDIDGNPLTNADQVTASVVSIN